MDKSGYPSSVRTIKGESKAECLDKLYKMYGLNFRVENFWTDVSDGFLGFFKKSFVTVAYQLLEDPLTTIQKNNAMTQGASSAIENTSPAYSSFGMPKSQPAVQQQEQQPAGFLNTRDAILSSANTASNVTQTIQMAKITEKLDSLQDELKQKMDDIMAHTISSGDTKHATIDAIEELLEQNEFPKSYIKNMVSRIKNDFTIEELSDYDFVEKKVLDWIAEGIVVAENENVNKVTILVGPTGVGKTTTVAKMGSRIAIDYKRNPEKYVYTPKIRMITTDTMRVAAVEQLSRWAEIINVQVDKAENSEDLRVLCERYAPDSDYIFVDTSGYSPNDFENIAKLRKILDVKNMNEQIFLTVNAGVSAKDFENIIKNFTQFNFKSVIITKCDETTSFGRIISVLSEHKLPVQWVTTGQEVLNTIEKPTALWFLNKLSGLKVDQNYLNNKFRKSDDK